jgi:hypothetical protein
MKGRSGHGGMVRPRFPARCPCLAAFSQVLAVVYCPAATCGAASPGSTGRGDGLRDGCLAASPAPATTDSPAPAPGLSYRHRPLDRSDGARRVPLGGPGRGGLSPPGPDRPVDSGDHRSRRACPLGCGAGSRPGGDSSHGTPGQLGGARCLASRTRNTGLGDLPSVSGGATRSLRARPARACRGMRDIRRGAIAPSVAGSAARRDSGDSCRPGATRRVGAVYVLRSGVPRGVGAGAVGVGRGGAHRSSQPDLSARRDASAFRGAD